MCIILNFLNRIFGRKCDHVLKNDEIDRIKRKIILENKKNTNKLRQANTKLKLMIERGEIEFRVIRNNKPNNGKHKGNSS